MNVLRRMISAQEFSERYHSVSDYLSRRYDPSMYRLKKKRIDLNINGSTLTFYFYENQTHTMHGRISACEICDNDHPTIYKIIQYTNGQCLFDLSVVLKEIIKRIKEWEALVSGA